MKQIDKGYFKSETLQVAKGLLGKLLVRNLGGRRVSGIIVETEAYKGPKDSASHAFLGKTKRNEVMFQSGGVFYIYLIYGVHHMLNIVTEHSKYPSAVLIRAIEPLEGLAYMRERRGVEKRNISNGPGKLTKALGIDTSLSGVGVGDRGLWIEEGRVLSNLGIVCSERIGINYADAVAKRRRWRFYIRDNDYVSRRI